MLARNRGALGIIGYDVSYSVNGGAAVTSNFVHTVSSGGFDSNLITGWTPPAAGSYNVKVWVSNPGGNTDEDNSNDTLSFTVQAATSFTRSFLAEEFSSSTCPPCKAWNDNLYNAALANYNTNNGKIVVKYQVPIPTSGDPSRNGHSDNRRSYYGINSAPSMVANGSLIDYSSAATYADAGVIYSSAETAGLAEAAFVDITGNATFTNDSVTSNTANLSVTANVTSNIDLSSGNYALQLVVAQKHYTFNGATNGDFQYHHVMRKMLPDDQGTALTLAASASTTVTETSSFTFGGVAIGNFNLWNDDIEVIAFVEDRNNQKILNASMIAINSVGIDEKTALEAKVYPNPANDKVLVDLANASEVLVEVVDMTGRVILSETHTGFNRIELNAQNLKEGMYIVNLTSEGKTGSQRISIIH